ncbi:MAG TPA: amidase [Solirubrobacteraceae bacterium]|nr:amidase [Solirubrobacteraceae bacterium]
MIEGDGEPRFVDPIRAEITVAGAGEGPLAGTTVTVKDVIDVAGVATGAGNPDWLAHAPIASAHATAVRRLLDAGATVFGKAITEEFAFSMRGVNMHYGVPRNPAAPGRVPGGSSSGSASAVALGITDLGLGTDTGGSIRVPASYCGVYGLRSTHGRVPTDGIVALAPSFDTCGVLARNGELLRRAGRALLGATAPEPEPPSELIVAGDLLELADREAADSVRAAAGVLAQRLGASMSERAVLGKTPPSDLADAFREHQLREIWAAHGAFISAARPRMDPEIAERFESAKALAAWRDAGAPSPSGSGLDFTSARRITRELLDALPPGAVIVLPSAPAGATTPAEPADTRARLLSLTCLAGLAGAPQVSLPLCRAAGLPLGLGLLARPGEDETLLAAAARSG